jgi:hypothetical protein
MIVENIPIKMIVISAVNSAIILAFAKIMAL